MEGILRYLEGVLRVLEVVYETPGGIFMPTHISAVGRDRN